MNDNELGRKIRFIQDAVPLPVQIHISNCFFFDVGEIRFDKEGNRILIEAVYNPHSQEKRNAETETVNGIKQPADIEPRILHDNDAVQETMHRR
jgi:hypothetical protein